MVGAILRSSRWNALSVKRESRKRLATGTPGGFLPDDPASWVRRAALSRCCSNLIQECFSDAFSLCDPFDDQHQTSLPQRTGDPQAPSGASELHGTQAGARQALEATAYTGEALGPPSPLGCGNRCGYSRAPSPIHLYIAIAIPHPIPVAPSNCPQDLRCGSRRGPGRSIWPEVDGVPAIRLQQIRAGLPHRIGCSTRRKPARHLRGVSLQLRRDARLGLLPDQHGAFETSGGESSGSAGLQS